MLIQINEPVKLFSENPIEQFNIWKENPHIYSQQVIGQPCWDKQIQIVNAPRVSRYTAIKSGHKVGKSNSAAKMALWLATCWSGVRVILTSSSTRQVRNILWRELGSLYRKAKIPIGGIWHDDPGTGLILPANDSEILGFTTDQPERMAGISGRMVVYIIDEASGFPKDIYEACEGNLAGGGFIIMFSNPTRTSGVFFDAFNDGKDSGFHTITISSEDTPNCTGNGDLVPGLATPEWIEKMAAKYGRDSDVFRVRVKGQFPQGTGSNIIALFLAEDAIRDWRAPVKNDGQLSIGVDVGRYGGDPSVIFPRRGYYAHPYQEHLKKNGAYIAAATARYARQLVGDGSEKVIVNVDGNGVGASVVDNLDRDEYRDIIEVNEIMVQKRSNHPKVYDSIRTEIWFTLQEWFDYGGCIPDQESIDKQVVATEYSFNGRGQMVAESKDDIKKRIGRSPDHADALGLSTYTGRSRDIVYA